MYIRSSPRGPNRDPNRTLSNELLLYTLVAVYAFYLVLIYIISYIIEAYIVAIAYLYYVYRLGATLL